MPNIQRMLKPIANRIVGNAIHVVGKKKQLSPKFPIARGIVGKLSNAEKKQIRINKADVCEVLAKAMSDVLNNSCDLSKRKRKIAQKVMQVARTVLSPRHKSSIKAGKKAVKVITHPKIQWGRRLGLALAGTGAAIGGGAAGYSYGKKRGSREGYVRALEDVMREAKSVSSNMEKKIEDLQKRGVTLGQLNKQFASMPVVGAALVREDLQPAKKNLIKDAIGYVPATSKPIGITGMPNYNPKPKNVRTKVEPDIKQKIKKPKQQKQFVTPRVGTYNSPSNQTQLTGFDSGVKV